MRAVCENQKDGDPRMCVAIVEITAGKTNAEFLRIKYDVEKTALTIISIGLAPYFAERLRLGQ